MTSDTLGFSQSPFAVLTFIAAPALLTNASSVLAMSTINRMLRTRDRMHDLFAESKATTLAQPEAERFLGQVGRSRSRRSFCCERCDRFTSPWQRSRAQRW
jgi:hypothetical protein